MRTLDTFYEMTTDCSKQTNHKSIDRPSIANESPVLPHRIRNNLTHNRPVLQRTAVLILIQSSNLIIKENRFSILRNSREQSRAHLMRRNKVALARAAAQEIRGHGIAEFDWGLGALLAEENHVGEVGVFAITFGWVLAEDAAGGEGSKDSADNEAGWVEVEIAGVVLEYVLAIFILWIR